jgi:hypothetical protein
MSKRHQDDYATVAARMATQTLVSRAASRLMRQMLDLYLGIGWVSVDAWQEAGPTPGYKLAVELHLDAAIALAAERRRVADVVKAATDREPFLLDVLDDGVRAVVSFSDDEAALAEMAALSSIH